jgi:transposase
MSSKRRKTAELSTEQRSAIIFGHKNGISQSKLANEFECSRRTIYNTLKRFEEYQLFESLPRTGRPPILSSRASTYLYLQARRHPFWTYKQLSAATPGHPSRSTIQRVLKQFGLGKWRSKRKIPIKPSLARKRLRFARKWRSESFQSWIFSDECSV